MGVALQKLFVVIGFDDEGVHLPQSLDDHLRRITEVSDEAEAARAGVKREADGIDGVVGHREWLHGDVADRELGAGAKDSPVWMLIQGTTAAHRFGG